MTSGVIQSELQTRWGTGPSAARPTGRFDRVVVAMLEGLNTEPVRSIPLGHLGKLVSRGAQSRFSLSSSPGMTGKILSSLLSGFGSEHQRLVGDRLYIPEGSSRVRSVPRLLRDEGLSTAIVMGETGASSGAMTGSLRRDLGLHKTRVTSGSSAHILSRALGGLASRADGLTLLHFPEPAIAGHYAGWTSQEYEVATRRLDETMRLLSFVVGARGDRGTLVVMIMYGAAPCIAGSDTDDTAVEAEVVLAGPGVHPGALERVQLCDVASTIVWALGLPVPSSFQGRVVAEAFSSAHEQGFSII